VNGNWVKTTQIPSDKASWGSFNALRENVDDASLDILNKILPKPILQVPKDRKSRIFMLLLWILLKEMQKD
jgi:putative endopeptidase